MATVRVMTITAESLAAALISIRQEARDRAIGFIERTAPWDTCKVDCHKVYYSTLSALLVPYIKAGVDYCKATNNNGLTVLCDQYQQGLITGYEFLSALVVHMNELDESIEDNEGCKVNFDTRLMF